MVPNLFATSAVVLLGYTVALWLVSLWLRDASIADIGWGPYSSG